jgi:outer membrane lipoprotein-sorting protein
MIKINDDHGIAHVAAIGLIAVVVAVVGFAGWRVMEKNKDGSSKNSSVATAEMKQIEQECNKELGDKDFCRFASSYNLETSYKMIVNTSGAEGPSVTEIEVDAKGNSSMISKEGDKETGGFITLDKVTYFKDVDSGTWYKMPSSDTSSEEPENPLSESKSVVDDFKGDKSTFKKIGKEKCGNLNCFKYQITESESPNTEQFVWFDDKDYMLRRWMTKEGAEISDMTVSYGSVNIKAPSPVKDYSTQSSGDIDAAIRAAQEAMTASEE